MRKLSPYKHPRSLATWANEKYYAKFPWESFEAREEQSKVIWPTQKQARAEIEENYTAERTVAFRSHPASEPCVQLVKQTYDPEKDDSFAVIAEYWPSQKKWKTPFERWKRLLVHALVYVLFFGPLLYWLFLRIHDLIYGTH